MNAGQLKKMLESVPDDAAIVVPTSAHSYRVVSAAQDTGLWSRQAIELEKTWSWFRP